MGELEIENNQKWPIGDLKISAGLSSRRLLTQRSLLVFVSRNGHAAAKELPIRTSDRD